MKSTIEFEGKRDFMKVISNDYLGTEVKKKKKDTSVLEIFSLKGQLTLWQSKTKRDQMYAYDHWGREETNPISFSSCYMPIAVFIIL